MSAYRDTLGATSGNVKIGRGGVEGSWFGMIALLLFLYWFLKRLGNDVSVMNPYQGQYAGHEDVEAMVNSIADYIDWNQVPHEPAYYQGKAQMIQNSLSGVGEDEDAVMAILMPMNGYEVTATYVAFGSRAGDTWGSFDGGDLIMWLRQYMRDSQQGDLKTIFNRTGGVLNY